SRPTEASTDTCLAYRSNEGEPVVGKPAGGGLQAGRRLQRAPSGQRFGDAIESRGQVTHLYGMTYVRKIPMLTCKCSRHHKLVSRERIYTITRLPRRKLVIH